MHRHITTAAFIALSGVLSICPALCIEEIEEAQEYLKQEEAGGAAGTENYAWAIVTLAETYQRYGMTKEADETFLKAIKLFKNIETHGNRKFSPSIYTNFARSIYKGRLPTKSLDNRPLRLQKTEPAQEDFSRIEALLKQAWKELTAVRDPYTESASHYVEVVRQYSEIGNTKEKQKCEEYLLSLCTRVERASNPTRKQVDWVAAVLNTLAYIEMPHGNLRPTNQLVSQLVEEMKYSKNVPPVSTVEGPKAKPSKVITSDQKAEMLRLRAVALTDRLRDDQKAQIEAHRNMALWYFYVNQKTKATAQIKVSSKLIGSDEPFLLFPVPPPCLGCGMG